MSSSSPIDTHCSFSTTTTTFKLQSTIKLAGHFKNEGWCNTAEVANERHIISLRTVKRYGYRLSRVILHHLHLSNTNTYFLFTMPILRDRSWCPLFIQKIAVVSRFAETGRNHTFRVTWLLPVPINWGLQTESSSWTSSDRGKTAYLLHDDDEQDVSAADATAGALPFYARA